jgi:hypothetical protein
MRLTKQLGLALAAAVLMSPLFPALVAAGDLIIRKGLP